MVADDDELDSGVKFASAVRGVLLARRPDSSFGGVPVGYYTDEVHMEEEEVQVQVQAEEEEMG